MSWDHNKPEGLAQAYGTLEGPFRTKGGLRMSENSWGVISQAFLEDWELFKVPLGHQNSTLGSLAQANLESLESKD